MTEAQRANLIQINTVQNQISTLRDTLSSTLRDAASTIHDATRALYLLPSFQGLEGSGRVLRVGSLFANNVGIASFFLGLTEDDREKCANELYVNGVSTQF